MSISRRQFLETTVLLAACGGGGGGTSGAITTANGQAELSFAQFPSLQNVGGGVIVDSSQGPLAVLRSGTASATALSAICTHSGCTVEYSSGNVPLYCPCHGSEFDGTGRVVAGPARRSLTSYPASVDSNGITVTLG